MQDGAPWTEEEDKTIMSMVKEFGFRWTLIASKLEGRSDSSVRNRHHRLVAPLIEAPAVRDRANEKPWTAEEDAILREGILHHGFKWRAICENLPGRSCHA